MCVCRLSRPKIREWVFLYYPSELSSGSSSPVCAAFVILLKCSLKVDTVSLGLGVEPPSTENGPAGESKTRVSVSAWVLYKYCKIVFVGIIIVQ